jgi:hypothetical protein
MDVVGQAKEVNSMAVRVGDMIMVWGRFMEVVEINEDTIYAGERARIPVIRGNHISATILV